MSRSTTALVVSQLDGTFELSGIRLDTIQPNEVLVQIQASGVCHTDISCSRGKLPCRPNAVLGHEGAGIIIEVGTEVPTLAKGDKVLLSFSHCETCAPCVSGHPAYCYTFNDRNFGGRRPDGSSAMLKEDKTPLFSSFFGQSSFARHTIVHRSSVVKVPEATDLVLFAPLGCGMQTGAGAVMNTLDVKAGSTLAVFGVGACGMAAVMAGKIRGARHIIAVDLHGSRIELAKKLGATDGIVVNPGVDDVVERIRQLCPPNGVDYAVECAGVPALVRTMVDSLGTRGKAVTVGAPGAGAVANIDVMRHLTFGKEYVGCNEGDSLPRKFIPYLMDMQAKGCFPLEQLITRYHIDDYKTAIEDSKEGRVIKAVLEWS